MSESDPMVFAARAAAMSDVELFAIVAAMPDNAHPSDFHQAVLDELEIRVRGRSVVVAINEPRSRHHHSQ